MLETFNCEILVEFTPQALETKAVTVGFDQSCAPFWYNIGCSFLNRLSHEKRKLPGSHVLINKGTIMMDNQAQMPRQHWVVNGGSQVYPEGNTALA